ncbi:hypothetical protein LLG96_04940 [bacterium]|nr:hypothetical protein [bacterium]
MNHMYVLWRYALSLRLVFLFVVMIIGVSCSEKRIAGRYESIIGTWRTERGIVMSIRMSPAQGAEASIKLAAGYGGSDVEVGKVLISNIRPMYQGGFSGIFEIPGNKKPVEVEISLVSPDTLLIISRDRRVKGNRMIWRRIQEKQKQ